MDQNDRDASMLIPDGGEKWLMKADGVVLAPIRGFEAVDEKIGDIRDAKSGDDIGLGKMELSIVDERAGWIRSLTNSKQYPKETISARIRQNADYIVVDSLEIPYTTDVIDGDWVISVDGERIKPVFGLDSIEIDGTVYHYVDGRLAEATKQGPDSRSSIRTSGSNGTSSRSPAGQRPSENSTETVERYDTHVPSRIPSIPEVSVSYDDLTGEEPIGSGGYADVSKATLPTPDGDVTLAIKRPRTAGTLPRDVVDRTLAEAETWDKLDDHDHIVGVADYGSEPMPWIAMEYMDGGHLGERSSEMKTVQALWTAITITEAIYHAHRRGIAHLDLKPQNVLFRTVEDAWEVPKVADWGLSKHLLEHSKSVDGMSVEYAAPEQFDDDYGQTDDRTDIYQLGAVFYDLFTGRPPFEGQPFKVIDMVKTDRPTPPSEIADVPDALDEILLTALAKEKDNRYDDIVYLRDDLRQLFENW